MVKVNPSGNANPATAQAHSCSHIESPLEPLDARPRVAGLAFPTDLPSPSAALWLRRIIGPKWPRLCFAPRLRRPRKFTNQRHRRRAGERSAAVGGSQGNADGNARRVCVYQGWSGEGGWVVNLKGTCGDANAGAIVPIGPKGFHPRIVEVFPHPATDAEIERSLKALSSGGNK